MTKRDFLASWRAAQGEDRNVLLRARFRHNADEFLKYALPVVFSGPWNPYHLAVLRRPKLHWSEQLTNDKRQDLAPRGVGKSTLNKGDVAHSICYGLWRFVVVLCSDIKEKASAWARSIRSWFERPTPDTEAMHRLYGPFKVTGTGIRFTVHGPLGPCTIYCGSLESSIQGLEEQTHRPDVVIFDDAEHRKKVRNPRIRDRWQATLNDEILKVGGRGRGLVVRWNCTIVHADAISQRIRTGKAPNLGWTTLEYPAVLSWPDRVDLWAQCERIFHNPSLGDPKTRLAYARAYYEQHREEMDLGSRVLDPHLLSIFECFRIIWEEGRSSFDRELQHKVRSEGAQLFQSEHFLKCRVVTTDRGLAVHRLTGDGSLEPGGLVYLDDCQRLIFVDPIPGDEYSDLKADGDYHAIIVAARDRVGMTYVLDGWIKRDTVSALHEAIWRYAEAYELHRVRIETNGFAVLNIRDLERQRSERKSHGHYWQVDFERHRARENKEARIASLEPALKGWISFSNLAPILLATQLDDFPTGTHDDGPDALQGAYEALQRLGGYQAPRMVDTRQAALQGRVGRLNR
jgi:predicted phage terminase large subunit-like protein